MQVAPLSRRPGWLSGVAHTEGALSNESRRIVDGDESGEHQPWICACEYATGGRDVLAAAGDGCARAGMDGMAGRGGRERLGLGDGPCSAGAECDVGGKVCAWE